MVKVITYGSFDVLHYGHIRLLQRAKALGDYLIVGVTSDDYDKTRGKINLQQSLMKRIEAVKATGIADEIIIEEYEGQKIDDIKKYNVDIFTVGSDWVGYFDYLLEYCQVVYLPRTEGVSSSEIRNEKRAKKVGLVGDAHFLNKVWKESKSVNGLKISALYTNKPDVMSKQALGEIELITDNFEKFISEVDAVYIRSLPQNHYSHIKEALINGKHVLCESPLTLSKNQSEELFELAKSKKLILMEAIKTAYATAYDRLLLLIKGGKIGKPTSVDATCTSIREINMGTDWRGIHEWGPTALLPVFQILGTEFNNLHIYSSFRKDGYDSFTKMDFYYEHGVASIKVGDGVKSEGDLIVSGTEGYIYVPSPWWITDYFEVRYENLANNKRYFYQLDGEGIRYELVAFLRAIAQGEVFSNINKNITVKISETMEIFENKDNISIIH